MSDSDSFQKLSIEEVRKKAFEFMAYRQKPKATRKPAATPSKGPKFNNGDIIGDLTIEMYQGHSAVNKRNSRIMYKAQHWYRCLCTCGNHESRSQQELIDPRRGKKCKTCLNTEKYATQENTHENQSAGS